MLTSQATGLNEQFLMRECRPIPLSYTKNGKFFTFLAKGNYFRTASFHAVQTQQTQYNIFEWKKFNHGFESGLLNDLSLLHRENADKNDLWKCYEDARVRFEAANTDDHEC